MLASYLAKYITKDFASHKLNEMRYWTSRGVVVCRSRPVGALLDRCEVFWRQELGVF
jgi:hypothetical protein